MAASRRDVALRPYEEFHLTLPLNHTEMLSFSVSRFNEHIRPTMGVCVGLHVHMNGCGILHHDYCFNEPVGGSFWN